MVAERESNSLVAHTRKQQDAIVVGGAYAVGDVVAIFPVLDDVCDLSFASLVLEFPYCDAVFGAPSASISYDFPPISFISHSVCLDRVAADDFGGEFFPALFVFGCYVSYDFEVSPRLEGDVDVLEQVFEQ